MGVVKTLLAGYSSGKEGDVIVPLEASILPPHASTVEKGSVGKLDLRETHTDSSCRLREFAYSSVAIS